MSDAVMRHTQKRPVARGNVRHDLPGTRQISIVFDDEQFDRIKARALVAGTSFAEEVRLLVEWGLEAEIPTSLKRGEAA